MEDFLSIIHFIVLGLSLAVPIGPMNIEVIKRGLTEGFLASWLVGIGGMTGDLFLLVSIFFGLQDLMQDRVIQLAMYGIGIVMLASLGMNSIYSAIKNKISKPVQATKESNAFLAGFTIALANPISLVFWFGVYGTSLQVLTSTHTMIFSLLCSLAIIFGLFLWNLNLVLTVHFSKNLLNETVVRGIIFLAGICLVGFAIQFLERFITLI